MINAKSKVWVSLGQPKTVAEIHTDLADRFTRDTIIPAASHYDRTMASLPSALTVTPLMGCVGIPLADPERGSQLGTAQHAYPLGSMSRLAAWKARLSSQTRQYGGPELGLVDCALISESLAYGCTGIQTAMEGVSSEATLYRKLISRSQWSGRGPPDSSSLGFHQEEVSGEDD